MHRQLIVVCLTLWSIALQVTHAQLGYSNVKDTMSGNSFIRVVEQSLTLHYQDFISNGSTDSIIAALNYEPRAIPQFSDDIICARLSKMNQTSDFGFDCNNVSLSMIKFFAANRRNFIKVILGRSAMYFDMFEEKLNEYGLPIELRFLAVIESGLRPQVKSRAGALGLWQFMYGTGKMYGLAENSYIDERMDPAKATDAACRYLKKLNEIYGDWNLALAAYNAGPGNVNKAIRRSGGKRTYWEVRPFLPRETQGYVPNFIAAAYLCTFAGEHNLSPVDTKVHYYQLDTMCLKRGVHMTTIDRLLNWSVDEIRALNPVYKTSYIPPTYPPQCITGPLDKIGLLVSMESSLYAAEINGFGEGNLPTNPEQQGSILEIPDEIEESVTEIVPLVVDPTIPKTTEIVSVQYTYHRVKNGETLGKIAAQYNASIQEIMDWNKMVDTKVTVGQMLKIQSNITTTIDNPAYTEEIQKVESAKTQAIVKSEPVITTPVKPAEVYKEPVVRERKKYYTIRRGDTFSTIADRQGMTMNELKRLNPGVRITRIQAGDRLRVR